MKANQSLKNCLIDFLVKDKKKLVVQKTELFIIGTTPTTVLATDDFIHYFELHGSNRMTENSQTPSKPRSKETLTSTE